MPHYLKIISVVFSAFFLLTFYRLIRNRSVKPYYSVLWLTISLFMISVIVFESFYKWIATSLGLTDASFLITIVIISFLMIYILYLSIKISEMGDRIQELISQTSILENKIRKIENDKDC